MPNAGRRCASALAVAAVAIAGVSSELLAADVGEISIIPDNGMIISAALLGNLYLERAACVFYRDHPDNYDAIFVWTNAQLNQLTRVQEGWPLRSAARGIGRDNWLETTSRFCARRLRHAVKMGDIDPFSDDPDARYGGIFGFTLTGSQLMGHEFGHQWLAGITFKRADGVRHCLVRGFQTQISGEGSGDRPGSDICDGHMNSDFNLHWSYFFNSGSVMYGNQIEDRGGGNFLFTNPNPKYSQLDQYLMGLRDRSEVPPMFVVDVGDVNGAGSTAFPLPAGSSMNVSGRRMDFTIDDVIRAEGPRVPAREGCHWKAAFIIVHPATMPPTAQQIAKVDRYRQRWEAFYDQATDHRGSFDTTLAGSGLGTPTCPAPMMPPRDAGLADAQAPDAPSAADAGDMAEGGGIDASRDADLSPEADAGPADHGAVSGHNDAQEPHPDDSKRIRSLQTEGCSCSAAPDKAPSAREPFERLLVALMLVFLLRRARTGGRLE